MARTIRKAGFIEVMECLPVTTVPDGPEWTYEIKLDGYRMEAVKRRDELTLYSRRKNSLNHRFEDVALALKSLPDETVIDGELMALDSDGKPSFNLLQNLRSAESHIIYYAFDILFRKGEGLTQLPLSKRREVLESVVNPNDHVGLSQVADKTSAQMLRFVRSHGLEGFVAKRADSVYQPGLRTGLWSKQRVNLGQEFVIGGYISEPPRPRFDRGGLLSW
jgi:ATP-dependent DNA ligase